MTVDEWMAKNYRNTPKHSLYLERKRKEELENNKRKIQKLNNGDETDTDSDATHCS